MSDYTYARQAIKLGVTDYLLKPYLDSELRETLDKVIAKAREKEDPLFESPFSNPVEDSSTFDYYRDLAKDLLWNAFFRRRIMAGMKKDFSMWGTKGEWLKVVLVSSPALISMGSFSQEVLKNYFHMDGVTVMNSIWMDQMAIALFAEHRDSFTELTGCIKRMRNYLTENSHIPVSCGVSGTLSGLDALPDAYEDAASFIYDYTAPSVKENFSKSTLHMRNICELEEKIIFFIANQDPNKVRQYLLLLAKELDHDLSLPPIPMKLNFGRSLMTIIRGVNQIPDIRLSTSEANLLFEKIGQWSGAYENLQEYIDIFSNIACQIHKTETPANTNLLLVQKAKEYVKLHYHEPINLQSAADTLGISFGYLSKCFRNAEPQPFSEYLTTYRLKEAKRMMKETDLTITEIAYESGFSDANYFGKCFKKKEGMSPREYLSMLQFQKSQE